MRASLPAVRRACRLAAPALLLLATSCIPKVYGGHIRPSVRGQAVRYHGSECGGWSGAGEVLEVLGPSGARLFTRLVPKDGRLLGRVGIHAPAGTTVTLGGDSLVIVRAERRGLSVSERAVRVDSVHLVHYGSTPVWGNGGIDGTWRHEAFTSTIAGRQEGTTMWIDFDAGPEVRDPRVTLRLPPLTVAGRPWSPSPISYRHRWGNFGMAPAEC